MTRRRGIVVGAVAVLAIAVVPAASANTVIPQTCKPPLGDRCYAVITQGISSNRSTLSLTNLTSATAKIDIACQLPDTSTEDFTNAELWLFTPPNPSGPGNFEFIETGISTGVLNHVYQSGHFFYWARGYWSPTSNAFLYNEYLLSGTVNTLTYYTHTINYGNGTWEVVRDGTAVRTGIQSQQAPGSTQAVQAGAEDVLATDGNQGTTKTLSFITSGTNHTSLTGYIFQDTNAYTISGGSSYISWSTLPGNGC
jgi:hypothetical protein